MTIDTLAYTKHLEEAGVERKQAEAFAEDLEPFCFARPGDQSGP